MQILSEKQILELSRSCALEPKLIQRAIGSLKVSILKNLHNTEVQSLDTSILGQAQTTRNVFELGLRLNKDQTKDLILLQDILREYANSCPQVVSWIGRGDFNPQEIPSEINFAKIMHSCRTVGRLRAKFLRAQKS